MTIGIQRVQFKIVFIIKSNHTSSEISLNNLLADASRAQADFDYESAIDLYGSAMELLQTIPHEIAAQVEYDFADDGICCIEGDMLNRRNFIIAKR